MNSPCFYNETRPLLEDGAHYRVEVVADTRSPKNGVRLTTVAATYPRYIHAQMLTHRMFSRNAQSSRAIPTRVLMDRVQSNPVEPLRWGSNQPGMVAGDELTGDAIMAARIQWRRAADACLFAARTMSDFGLHKESVNRVLEPFSTITAIYSATEWGNFFRLRLEDDAQPEIQKLARMLRDAMDQSDIACSDYHLPYISSEEYDPKRLTEMCDVSAARCARVSYLNHDGAQDISKDLKLAKRLSESGHWSPFEHPAISCATEMMVSNLRGWESVRDINRS